ncbi:MAG: cell division protein FtsZ, partial [Candidatus Brennerbacteria bacterium]|nr:cell division protein FtsZ [Candidatus Brennerbacteria bacterium]
TKPFSFEGSQRSRIAQEGLIKLKDKVDALVVVPNDRIFSIIDKETPIIEAFEAIDDVLKNALRGIVELIVTPGLINVDFADVRSVVQDAGSAIVGLGIGAGEDKAASAVDQALNSPLLETSVEGARGILLGISGSRKLGMNEVNEVAKMVAQIADPSARIIFGAYYDRHLRANQLKVTLIATGFEGGVPASSLFSSGFRDRESKHPSFFGGSPTPSQPRLEEIPSSKGNLPKTESQPPKKLEPSETKKKESDVWDIPTFLRKKRK